MDGEGTCGLGMRINPLISHQLGMIKTKNIRRGVWARVLRCSNTS